MSAQKKEDNRAEEQARAQLSGIVEMVDALTMETAAQAYAQDLTRERCVDLLNSVDIECYDSETVEELRESVAANITDETLSPDDFEFDEERAREAIQEDALSVEVRSDWYTPGGEDGAQPTEYMILLCTGGPAARIVGDLDQYKQPTRARLEYQDWGTPWTELVDITSFERAALLTYAQQLYFGD